VEAVAKKALVLDASAFIAGIDSLAHEGEAYTTFEVAEELKSRRLKDRFETSLSLGRIRLREPNKRYLEDVKEASASTGDLLKLSKADVSILALALQLRDEGFNPTIVSEDYAVQNVAEHLGLKYEALTGKIKVKARWLIYCSACGRSFKSNFKGSKCPICGGEIKRKMLGKAELGGRS